MRSELKFFFVFCILRSELKFFFCILRSELKFFCATSKATSKCCTQNLYFRPLFPRNKASNKARISFGAARRQTGPSGGQTGEIEAGGQAETDRRTERDETPDGPSARAQASDPPSPSSFPHRGGKGPSLFRTKAAGSQEDSRLPAGRPAGGPTRPGRAPARHSGAGWEARAYGHRRA